MRIVRITLYVLMALVLAAGWGFLYWQSNDIDLQSANAARAALNELSTIDTRWNDQLVGTRIVAPGAPAAGAAKAEPAPYGRAYASLELHALRLSVPPRALTGVKTAFDEKAALMASIAAGD